MKRDEALRILFRHQEEIRGFGVKSIAIFGSVARDEAEPGSDVDLLVEFGEPVGLFEFVSLKNRLEDVLGSPVDLVTEDAPKRQLRELILGEAITAA